MPWIVQLEVQTEQILLYRQKLDAGARKRIELDFPLLEEKLVELEKLLNQIELGLGEISLEFQILRSGRRLGLISSQALPLELTFGLKLLEIEKGQFMLFALEKLGDGKREREAVRIARYDIAGGCGRVDEHKVPQTDCR
jgi:hypothetical protein